MTTLSTSDKDSASGFGLDSVVPTTSAVVSFSAVSTAGTGDAARAPTESDSDSTSAIPLHGLLTARASATFADSTMFSEELTLMIDTEKLQIDSEPVPAKTARLLRLTTAGVLGLKP